MTIVAATEPNSEGNALLSYNAGEDLSRTRQLQAEPEVSKHTVYSASINAGFEIEAVD